MKSNLYYSKKEIYHIQRSLKAAIALRKKRLLAEKLEKELKGNRSFLECLEAETRAQAKRALEEAQSAPECKRQKTIKSC